MKAAEEDDMKQRQARGKQVIMAPASLLFKAISRLDVQGTTPLDVYVGEVIYCKYISEKSYVPKYSTFITIILIVIFK